MKRKPINSGNTRIRSIQLKLQRDINKLNPKDPNFPQNVDSLQKKADELVFKELTAVVIRKSLLGGFLLYILYLLLQ